MTPQQFRQQLEAAIENRDQDAIRALELHAASCDENARLWEEFQLIERAIGAWQTARPVVPSRPLSRFPQLRRAVTFAAASTLAVGVLVYSQFPARQTGVPISSAAAVSNELQTPAPQPIAELVDENDAAFETSGKPSMGALLPVTVVTHVRDQFTQEFQNAWGVISRVPDDASAVYERIEEIVPAKPETAPAEESPGEPTELFPVRLFRLLS
ncbi:hypothetical protein [Rubinisphaera margarita]|uniref:hypothetical protein n=1 Tax=Rubinisphaera margarita TaxID=2909586 RepID=UPI001EE821B3|nr:hypothetical protein [Rubinisphaera margarita]MCG6156708.1 hypothetical protein [Rubinisphaera margarita]